MAWQFERFEGAPHLEDYVEGQLKFRIMFATDAPGLCTDTEYLAQFQGEMPDDFFKRIKPHFSFPNSAIPHSDGYDLEFFNDDIGRHLMSRVQDPKHPNVFYNTPKKVGHADYLDLCHIGTYGARRIPDIPIEIRLSAQALGNDLPRYAIDQRKYFTRETAMIDWNDFVHTIGGQFKELFLSYVKHRFDSKKLTPEQAKTLTEIVKGLNKKS